MIFPIVFKDDEEKKATNLRVIRRILSDTVLDYDLVIPACSVYQAFKNEWQKLRIYGPLFVLSLSDFPQPLIFILNTTSFDNPENFRLMYDRETSSIRNDGAKVFIKIKENNNNSTKQFCISADSPNDGHMLASCLLKSQGGFSPFYRRAAPADGSFDFTKDPTVRHLFKAFTKR
ncbi:hypothetical protein TRFO_26780 [Tritrichomonas foetus]|uniref:Uncharacterized protein n=1 Tax=Tritrichomonas foetus TaxID=1144522 RepID=A0A1J4K239_9EUKA|nr:hypothetical protein TRFO_26780 [Tritrichomonas foetus]|eukprot:OHT05505.1 hypothetical protein TRFO_26780 [Tritrichomonas foetus]